MYSDNNFNIIKMRKSDKIADSEGDPPRMHLVASIASRPLAYLTKEEVERFFAVIPHDRTRDRLLFDLIYRHGLRRREAGIIGREHAAGGRIWITRVKGGVSGEYRLHPTTTRLLWSYLNERSGDENPYLIVGRQRGSSAISPSLIYQLFRKYAELAQIPSDRCHPHVLRHSIAVHLMNAGWDAADVQDWLGHRDIASTMVYAAVTNKRREAKYEEALLSREIAGNEAS
jgi:integrase